VLTPRARSRALAILARDQLLAAALYAGTAQLAFTAAVVEGSACPVWPPTAVALVAVLWRGRAILPGIALGAAIANASRPIPALVVAITVAVNTLEPVVTVALLRRLRVDVRLCAARDVALFIGAGAVGAVMSAVGGVGGLWLAGSVDADAVAAVGALWALGNVAGLMCIAPIALVSPVRGLARSGETVLVVVLAVVAGTVILSDAGAEVYGVFPLLIWAGLRLGPRGAATVTFALAMITVAFAARGEGPFVDDGVTASLLTSQGFILATALTTLMLAAVTEDRRRAGRRLARSEREKREMAEEQAALRRVATAVAEQAPSDVVLDLVAREVAGLAGVEVGVICRYRGAESIEIAGVWSSDVTTHAIGTIVPIAPGGPVDRARTTGRPTRCDERGSSSLQLPPILQRVAAPVWVDGRPWGAVVAGTSEAEDLPTSTETRLGRFADLVSLAIANAEQQAQLTAQARTDPLTGLLNHRAFHERLREEVLRAQRHGRGLSVAVFDIDRFKEVNDTLGHRTGDEVLALAARSLESVARGDEPVGRVGGDEIAVIMPEVGGLDAFAAADRLRRALGSTSHADAGTITASAGVCSLEEAGSADELLRLADGALYWAKAHGRDVCFRYSPDVVEELSAAERAERLARSQALTGIRALARAIDAKDPVTTEHSERVAEVAVRIALLRGWSGRDAERLREAGLVHDVGKIGVPDAILFKPGRLTPRERTQVERHAELGAAIAREVLDPEQVEWILCHHEHEDGGGYPRGLAGDEVAEGGAILAVADAWDAMTRARPYSHPMPPEAARDEIVGLAGAQFNPSAVSAFAELFARGDLDDGAPAPTGVSR
jgi:diguanylate cyclase (GGDEF)-like protein/putative nucleotidyltransferase with HDIG domain